jgi:galactosylceramidase
MLFLLMFTPFTFTTAPPFLNATAPGQLTYDGHGALSAGASSRLLYDYSEPYRSDILDYLYTPKFGASLDLIKVEIGGDSQSTDGTEPSHQHTRTDLNCHRGYEWWLLEEAKKRNPDVVTYALSWAVPHWVGNDTYYSTDNIQYHLSWLKCLRDEHPTVGSLDYIGAWNERAWGGPDWIVQLRQAMDDEGFEATKIIIPDGGYDPQILSDIDASVQFAKAMEGGGIGLHYPCNTPHPEVQQQYGLKYWSSEDYSTEATWAGAGCWGRLLNQNVVRMNMTSTIAWSLLWGVYSDFPYFGNGLMYAYAPWSNFYEINQAIWTSAHHTQFIAPGWVYVGGGVQGVGGGKGYLNQGGTYVALMSPDSSTQGLREVTIVLEKLHGDCLRCAGQNTTRERFTLVLGRTLRHETLSMWQTNASKWGGGVVGGWVVVWCLCVFEPVPTHTLAVSSLVFLVVVVIGIVVVVLVCCCSCCSCCSCCGSLVYIFQAIPSFTCTTSPSTKQQGPSPWTFSPIPSSRKATLKRY